MKKLFRAEDGFVRLMKTRKYRALSDRMDPHDLPPMKISQFLALRIMRTAYNEKHGATLPPAGLQFMFMGQMCVVRMNSPEDWFAMALWSGAKDAQT